MHRHTSYPEYVNAVTVRPIATGDSTTPSRPHVSQPYGFLKGALQCHNTEWLRKRYFLCKRRPLAGSAQTLADNNIALLSIPSVMLEAYPKEVRKRSSGRGSNPFNTLLMTVMPTYVSSTCSMRGPQRSGLTELLHRTPSPTPETVSEAMSRSKQAKLWQEWQPLT